jgi:hypothetical protein
VDIVLSDFAAGALAIVLVVLSVAFVVAILASIHGVFRRNKAFLANAIVAQDLPPGAMIVTPFQPAPGWAHAIWLDLSLRSDLQPAFDVQLSVRLGGRIVIEGTYPVRFDSEGDASGLPNASGTTALNSSYRSGLGGCALTTVLRAFRFDAPPMPMMAEVHARFIAPPEVVVERARLLVTVKDSPF